MNVPQLRQFVTQERERIKERHRFGVSGAEIVEENTQLVDNVIAQIYHAASEERMLPRGLEFAATGLGSYGRRELNPHSDVDVMILTDASSASRHVLASFASFLVATLWDVGFEVGHSTRTIRDCVRLLQEDSISRTALMEARFVIGKPEVFEIFEQRMEKTLFRRNVSEFIALKTREWKERHETYGSSLYIQEPDVKEGIGGLRDLHTAFWIARARYGIRHVSEFPEIEILSAEMTKQVHEAIDFLWRVRNELHYLKDRQQDQLTFELQQDVAHHLGFRDVDHTLAEEHLMRDYFKHVHCIYEAACLVIHRAEDKPAWKRWWHERRRTHLTDTLYIQGDVLHFEWEKAPRRAYLDLFAVQQDQGVPLHPEAREAVRSFAVGMTAEDRQDRSSTDVFLDLLRRKDGVADILRSMHQLGLLKALIPEFALLQYLIRRDYYHRYTLDEHTFLAIENLDATSLAEVPYGEPIRDMLELVEKPDLIRLALLFHDIGIPVGGPKGHDERSTELAGEILDRFEGLSPKDRDLVLFLIQHHLLMSRTAQQRDLDSPAVIQRFVEAIVDEEHLRMLYLLTFADMRAVNTEIWNEWNATLLGDLYTRSLQWMAGGYAETLCQRNELMTETEKLLVSRDIPQQRIQRHFDTMPERAWLGMKPEEIALHICIIEDLQTHPFMLRLNEQRDGYTSLIVCTRDSEALFHRITGVLAAEGINILSADLFTREDGVVLDLLNVTSLIRTCLLSEDIPRLEQKMIEGLVTPIDVSTLIRPGEAEDMTRRGIESEVSLNNEESEEYTIIDIHTQDRLGLLYRVTGVFQELGLDIGLAKISTEAHSVADSFYVLDDRHRKILDSERQRVVRETILKALDW